MKTLRLIATLGFILMLSKVSLAQDGIANSPHDFSDNTSWNDTGQICIVCHTPHDADTTVSSGPLWNHELSKVASYTTYAGYDLEATVGQPDGTSKLCLGCHDGTVALESFGGNGMTGTTIVADSLNIGGPTNNSLAGDHPISIDYVDQTVTDDGELHPLSTTVGTGNILSYMLNNETQMQCSSCHDVHNTSSVGTKENLLKVTLAGSALCLTCHKK